jgi:ornithine decarboxylase
MKAKFLLSKKVVRDKISFLEDLGIKVIYSYKTNHEVGDVIQEECENVDFSIHAFEEIDMIKDKKKISFFTQAELESNLKGLLKKGIRNFVVDNEVDLERLLKVISEEGVKIDLSLRMKFREHRIGTGRYFVYGLPAKRVNELLLSLKDNLNIGRLGVHIHRKSQNTSEWEIKEEIEDSLSKEALERLDMLNLGGGLPTKYRSYTANVMKYIVEKLKVAKEFLDTYKIETIIEPGRFIAAPSVKLFAEVIQVYEGNVILNTTIYNCCLDTIIGQHKLLVEEELLEGEGEYYLIKGNSPTRDDIFRYKVKLNNPKVGDIITFLNAGAYNYTTDFFGYKKLETEIVEDF